MTIPVVKKTGPVQNIPARWDSPPEPDQRTDTAKKIGKIKKK